MNNYNKSFFNIIEGFNSIVFKKRMFFPRNFNLSDEFLNALKKEIDRLKKENYNNGQVITKLSKALHFLVK